MVSSSSVSILDNYCFQSAFNEELYNTIMKNKKVISEVCFDLMDDEYPEIENRLLYMAGEDWQPPNLKLVRRSFMSSML
ncbi:hypothetical protein PIB30_104902, partial [Stylosanthes scabra]|nr:hypothetical protein [Stylosanthes scabra]